MISRARFGWLVAILLGGALTLVLVEACTKDGGGGAGSGGETAAVPPLAMPNPTPNPGPEAVHAPPASASGFGVPISLNKCPSAVPGSTTTVKELPDGVEVTVIAAGGPPINDIRQRGVQIVAAAKDPATGGGSTADGLSKCPVVVKDAIVTETDVPGGAAFTVKPVKAPALAELKKETKARATSYVGER